MISLTQASLRSSDHLRKALWLLAIGTFGILSVLLGSQIVLNASEGADFTSVFSEPAQTIDGDAEVVWVEGQPLLRTLEPQTMEAIEFAWIRSQAAVDNAAVAGDRTGIDVWFSGPAHEQVNEVLATGAIVDAGNSDRHVVTSDFYSIDGQILMAHIDRTDDSGDLTERVRVVFILRDGNWRVEHLTRIS